MLIQVENLKHDQGGVFTRGKKKKWGQVIKEKSWLVFTGLNYSWLYRMGYHYILL